MKKKEGAAVARVRDRQKKIRSRESLILAAVSVSSRRKAVGIGL